MGNGVPGLPSCLSSVLLLEVGTPARPLLLQAELPGGPSSRKPSLAALATATQILEEQIHTEDIVGAPKNIPWVEDFIKP